VASVTRPLGTVAGYDVRAAATFRFLREAGGVPGDPIDVREAEVEQPSDGVEPLLRWVRRPDNPFEASLYAVGERYVMAIPGMGTFRIDPGARAIEMPPGADPVRREARLWGVPAALMATRRGDLPVHAATVEVDGRALLLCGPSRFGKTTLAVGFMREGHRVLSEDLSCCRADGSAAVLPGPALLRVRRDVHDRLGPFASTSIAAEDDDRVHLSLDGRLRGTGDPVPLAGVVVLRRGAQAPELFPVAPERFIPELFTMSFGLPTDADRARSFGAVAALAGAAPMWVLDRPLRFDVLGDVVSLLIDRCLARA
jgi:hypothetical protein